MGAGGGGAEGLQWLLPLLSHSPLSQSIFIYSPIWINMLALLTPGWRPCLLKSEFHLACAKPALQGEISCWKPGGCWRTVAAVCILPRAMTTGSLIHRPALCINHSIPASPRHSRASSRLASITIKLNSSTK